MIERIDRSRSPECATSPHALRIPDRSGHPAIRYSSNRLQVRLGCVRLSPSCPFRLLHTALLPGQRGITPAFGYGAPHPSAEGTSTPLTHALPSAHYEPLRHPTAPSLSLAGVWLVIPDHPLGLPVLRALSFLYVLPPVPRCSDWASSSLISPSRISLPRSCSRVGLHIDLFGACSAFTQVAARTLAPSPICDQLHRRLQPLRYLHDCSGCFRLERSPGGICTHWKAPPCHGARASADASRWVQMRKAVVPPLPGTRSDLAVIFDLACRLGFGEHFFAGDVEAGWRHLLEPSGITLEDLRAHPVGVKAKVATQHRKYAAIDPGTGRPRGFP